MSAIADVTRQNRNVRHATRLPRRTPATALIRALADYPGLQLWTELRQMLPPEAAARAFRAAAQLYRDTKL